MSEELSCAIGCAVMILALALGFGGCVYLIEKGYHAAAPTTTQGRGGK